MFDGLVGRIFKIIQLRPMSFREIIDDKTSIRQAIFIICLVSVSESFGRIIGEMHSLSIILPVSVSILLQWIFISGAYYLIGNFLYRNKVQFTSCLSIVAFCHVPWVLTILFALVGLSFSVYLILTMSLIWVLLTLMMCFKVLIGGSFISSFTAASFMISFGYLIRNYIIPPIY